MNTWRFVKRNPETDSLYRDGKEYAEGSWVQMGVDHGNGTKPILLWFKSPEFASERFVVFKIPAGKHFQTILDRQHPHPGQYHIARLIEEFTDAKGVECLRTEELFEMPITQKKEVKA